uniref:Uncharacterized protein n=1 Tax=Lactuca sativa TaxID=4236 RepID=A0A9R1WI80_LACSA|nr:hypothetical protein LSAT_V11C100046900 [Lactuca sativa]
MIMLEEFRKKKAAAKKAASSNSVNGDLHEVKTSVADAINTFNKPSTNNNPKEDNNHSNLNHYSNIGALLGTYEDNRFKSESKKPYLKSIGSLNLGGGPELEKKLKYTEHVCSGIILGKELVNAPPNVLTPGVLAEEAEKIASTIDCDKLSDIGSEYEGFVEYSDYSLEPWKYSLNGDSLLIILKSFIEKQSAQSTRKLSLCMSARVDSQLFSHYFGDCPVIHAQGRTHPVPTYFLEDIHDSVDYKLLASDSLASLRSNAPKQKESILNILETLKEEGNRVLFNALAVFALREINLSQVSYCFTLLFNIFVIE